MRIVSIMDIKNKILKLRAEGKSIGWIAKELNIPLHQVRNTVYRNTESSQSNGEKEAKAILKQAKKVLKVTPHKLPPKSPSSSDDNQDISSTLVDLKNKAHFGIIADHIERITEADARIGKLQELIDAQTKITTDALNNMEQTLNPALINEILASDYTSYGHVLNLNSNGCSYVVYRQNIIEQKRIKTLPEVRGTVTQMLIAQKKHEAKRLAAQMIVDQTKALGTQLASYTNKGHIQADQTVTVQNNGISPEIFTKKIGESFLIENGNTVQIVKINADIPYNGAVTEVEIKQSANVIQGIYYNTFLKELIDTLYKKYNVEIKNMPTESKPITTGLTEAR